MSKGKVIIGETVAVIDPDAVLVLETTDKTANDLKIEELEGIMACFIKAMKQDFYLPEIKDKALQEVWRVLNAR